MSTIRRILVAVNPFAAKSFPAVLKAAQIARACGAEVELFHALAEPLYRDTFDLRQQPIEIIEEELRQKALHPLEALADRLKLHSIRVSVAAEWDFPVHEAIIRRAMRIKADLIVVSRHAKRHLMPSILRLTDWELVRFSPIPVLLVKNARPYRRPAVLAAIDPTHAFAKPAALDKQILNIGGLLSEKLAGKLHAVHVYARIPASEVGLLGRNPDALHSVEVKAARDAKRHFERAIGSKRIARAHRYLIGQHPINGIVDAVKQSRCTMLVMGAVSRSGIKRLLIGNTAERILDEVSCDILVVKPAQWRNKIPAASRGAQLRSAAMPGFY